MPTVPPNNIVEPVDLARFNVPAAFLAQCAPAPIDILITTAGNLGTMAFTWRETGEANYSPTPFPSSASVTSWTKALDVVTASVIFAATYYSEGDTCTIDEAGNVTGSMTTVTATRYDRRATACSAVTAEAMWLMQDAIHAPLLTWTDDARTHAAAMVYAILKSGRGATANNAGMGDENIYSAAATARAYFLAIGEKGKPNGWVDTSPTTDGPIFPAYPSSPLPARGW